MYCKYQEAVDAFRHEQLGRKHSEAMLEQVASAFSIYFSLHKLFRYSILSIKANVSYNYIRSTRWCLRVGFDKDESSRYISRKGICISCNKQNYNFLNIS